MEQRMANGHSHDASQDSAARQKQFEAFTSLRNEIIGHESKKTAAIETGVCAQLVHALALPSQTQQTAYSSILQQPQIHRRSSAESINALGEQDQLRLQAIFIVNSLANAGTAYIAPIVASGIVPLLLNILSPEQSPPRLIVESLRTVLTIASRLRNDPLDVYRDLNDSVSAAVVDPQSSHLQTICRMLQPDWNAPHAQDQFLLTLQLIDVVAEGSDKRQQILVSAGVLDLLSSIFAAWVAGNQRVFRSNDAGLAAAYPEHPPRSAYSHISRAVVSIIGNSSYRTLRFLSCKDMIVVFPDVLDMIQRPEEYSQASENGEQQRRPRRWDRFLPRIYSQQGRSDSSKSTFPPLISDRQQSSTLPDALAWLIHMARSTVDEERIVTLLLLSMILKNTGTNVKYVKHLARLVVPLLTQSLKLVLTNTIAPKLLPSQGVRELILALKYTIADCGDLQATANESKALETLCHLLKKTFALSDHGSRPKMWSPNADEKFGEVRAMNDANRLGPPGATQNTAFLLFVRAGAMSALASLAEKEDKIRKDIIDSGAMQYIVESVTPQPVKDTDASVPPSTNQYAPSLVMTAALDLLVTLSRSVGMLRTSLIDAKVALPVLELARQEDQIIKRHATDALTNMLLQFSPMKEELIKNNVHNLLCEYAHSTDTELRISALWALKHLVVQVPNELKIEVLQQLGPAFVMSLLSGESSTSHKKHLAIANVRGEKVDILNDEPEMEVDGPLPSPAEAIPETNDDDNPTGLLIRNEFGPSPYFLASLQPLKLSEENSSARTRRDGIYIQHHVLDLIRNMLAEPTDQHPELVDDVLNLLGANRFFECIISKFKPKSSSAANTTNGTTSGKQPRLTVPGNMGHIISSPPTFIDGDNYTHHDILHSACFVLAHIANGRPAHKTMVIQQPQMLTSLLPHFLHPSVSVRIGCLWIVCNVLWVESGADSQAGIKRATDMRRSGIEDRCRELLGDNSSMDVQERAKYVAEGFAKLLDQQHIGGADRNWSRE